MNNSLQKLTQATQWLAEAKTLNDIKHIMDIAEAAKTYARAAKLGLQAYNDAAEVKTRAERKAGELLAQLERGVGGQPTHNNMLTVEPSEYKEILDDNDINYMTASRWQQVAQMPEDQFEKHLVKLRGERPITTSGLITEIKRSQALNNLNNIETQATKKIIGVYDVIVIDPPWNMNKIERELAPNQVLFDYPTMTVDEISQLSIPIAEDCHVWLWTTHRYLPAAFSLLSAWNLKYICTFVWHKPGGFQPFNLPQYNCEFVLYAKYGNPIFTNIKDFPVCFNSPRTKHSEKPDEFYQMVAKHTAGRRLDMFNRRHIDGFDGWGKEAADVS